jgi:hypothetical protein
MRTRIYLPLLLASAIVLCADVALAQASPPIVLQALIFVPPPPVRSVLYVDTANGLPTELSLAPVSPNGDIGPDVARCMAPCRIDAPIGRYLLRSPRLRAQRVLVLDTRHARMRVESTGSNTLSQAVLVSGLVLLPIGVILALVGGSEDASAAPNEYRRGDPLLVGGFTLAGGGLLLAIGGLAMRRGPFGTIREVALSTGSHVRIRPGLSLGANRAAATIGVEF